MDLIQLIVVLAVVGLVLYLVQTYIPMAAPFKTIINVVVIVVLCIWLLRMVGIGNVMIGR